MSKQAAATAEGGAEQKTKEKSRKYDSRSIAKFVTQVQ